MNQSMSVGYFEPQNKRNMLAAIDSSFVYLLFLLLPSLQSSFRYVRFWRTIQSTREDLDNFMSHFFRLPILIEFSNLFQMFRSSDSLSTLIQWNLPNNTPLYILHLPIFCTNYWNELNQWKILKSTQFSTHKCTQMQIDTQMHLSIF